MRIDEQKVINKIVKLATEVLSGKGEDTHDVRLARAESNCSQIIAICELLEFEKPVPNQGILYEPFNLKPRGVESQRVMYQGEQSIYETPGEVTQMFKDAMHEQKEPVIPTGPGARYE